MRELVGPNYVPYHEMKSAEIHPIYIDDKDDDVVFVVYLYEGDNIVRQQGFRDHTKAEELVKNWTNAS
jgi:hypothetical protein